VNGSPRGWDFATIGDILRDGLFIDGDWVETKDQDASGDVRLIQLADVGDGCWRNRSDRSLTSQAANRLRCSFLEPGDVLIARMPEPVGRACIYPGEMRRAVTAVDVCICRPNAARVDAKWFMWTINCPQVRHQIEALQSGTTRRRISRRNLATVSIHLPPLHEQRQIAEVIEEQLSRLDAAQRSLYAAERKREALARQLLRGASVGSWPMVTLGDIARSMRNGIFVSRPAAAAPGIPIFRISAVRPMLLDVNDVRYAPADTTSVEKYFVDEGDLLFTRYSGNSKYVGSCAAVKNLARRTLHPDKLIRVVLDRGLADPSFVCIAVNNGDGRRQIEERLKTTAGQVGIAGSELRDIRIRLPELSQQRAIAQAMEGRLDALTRMQASVAGAGSQAGMLRRSILQKAFSGQLVPAGRNAEKPTSAATVPEIAVG